MTSISIEYDRRRVLGVIEQMNEEHARNGGDMEMSLGGYFEPFPFERKQVLS
jgi:hypothetical protein